MTSITFTVPGKVIGKQRARVTRFGTYTPKATVAYEKSIAWTAKASGVQKIEGAVRLLIQVYSEPPKSMPQKARLEAVQRIIRPQTKPDLDNVLKTVLDALNGIAYEDDKQVTDIAASKFYGEPQIVVTVGAA